MLKVPGLTWLAAAGNKIALPLSVDGISYHHPIGLAAGFDKNALYLPILQNLGFSFAEIGTVTPLPQAGNPKPRLFRLKKDSALLNRMGFNNDGAEIIAQRLEKVKPKLQIPIGVNIGKNKQTPNQQASLDYVKGFDAFAHLAEFFVVNVSSPNTPGLRDLQNLAGLKPIVEELANRKKNGQPIYVKIAPDMSIDDAYGVAQLIQTHGFEGMVISNTSIQHKLAKNSQADLLTAGAGGLSGEPINSISNSLLKAVAKEFPGLTYIGSGGVMEPQDIRNKIEAGASLVELYTGFIYSGPALIGDSLRLLANQPS